MTAAIRAITELSIKLRCNDRFGRPHNAMCVCVMIGGSISELISSAICWSVHREPPDGGGGDRAEASAHTVTLHKRDHITDTIPHMRRRDGVSYKSFMAGLTGDIARFKAARHKTGLSDLWRWFIVLWHLEQHVAASVWSVAIDCVVFHKKQKQMRYFTL